jgi:hypothetical protein
VLELRPSQAMRARTTPAPSCQADVVAITGSAFINHSLEALLGLCRGCLRRRARPDHPALPILFDHART